MGNNQTPSGIRPPDELTAKSRGQLVNKILLIVFAVPCGYLLIYNFIDSQEISIPLLMLFFILPVVIYVLNRFRQFNASKFIGLLGYNVCIFLVASSEPNATGVYLHFISCCTVTIALFRFEEGWKNMLFVGMSITLFILVNLVSFQLLPFRHYTPENVRLFFVMHTVATTLISSYCIFLVLSSNHRAQRNLYVKQEIIESQNDELRKANKELDKFVYSASHDLKAPLTSIQGLINLMEIDPSTPPQDYLAKIRKQIAKMEAFLRDVVDYSRNSRVAVKLETFNLHRFINEIHESLQFFENAKQVNFENTVSPHTEINSDVYRMGVILSNLISNAFRYADPRKARPFVRVSMQTENNCRVLRIEDNGVGIGADQLPFIFGMFYRASSGATGNGLGLYIARESAEKLNYPLDVQSTPGAGTVFTLTLPLTQPVS